MPSALPSMLCKGDPRSPNLVHLYQLLHARMVVGVEWLPRDRFFKDGGASGRCC